MCVGLCGFDVPNDDFTVIVDGDEVRAEGKKEVDGRRVMTGIRLVHIPTAL